MFSFLKRKKVRRVVVLAVLVRLLIIPFLFHPDIKTYHFQASFLSQGVIDIYTYLISNRLNLPLREEFVYFPFTYFFLGGWQAIVSPLLGSGFIGWVADASGSFVNQIGAFRYLTLLKFPYLVMDVMVGLVLTEFFEKNRRKFQALVLWLFNPITPIIIYAFSNFDVLVVLLTLVSFLMMKRGKFAWSVFILSVAAGFKLYPLILLPFYFLTAKDVKQKAVALVLPAVLLFAEVLPFLSSSFVASAFVSGLTTRLLIPGISLGFGERVIPAVFVLSILFIVALPRIDKSKLLEYIVATFLIIFSFSHYHIAWLIWVAPFLILFALKIRKYTVHIVLLCVLAFVLPFLYQDKSMTVSLFRLISSNYDLVPTPYVIVQKVYDSYSLQGLVHSLFAGGAMLLVWRSVRSEA